LNPIELDSNPHSSPSARFDSPGEIWVLTSEYRDVITKDVETGDSQTHQDFTYGFVPLRNAIFEIDKEQTRRQTDPDYFHHFEVEAVRVLPMVMADYTRAFQTASRRSLVRHESFDIETFRNKYFELDPENPDMTKIFKGIKQEYLGDTTWGTVLTAEMLIRVADYAIGLVPFAGTVWDFAQASRGTEFPFPGVERLIRHELRKRNLPLPEGIFDKPFKSRLLELADSLIGVASIVLPPAWIAKVPLDTIMEVLLYLDKMRKTREYSVPFLEIAEDTGTMPKVINKVKAVGKALPDIMSQAKRRLKK
jgi:hypothetical protein